MPRVLHIEDDAPNRLLVRKLLQMHDIEVIDACDGLEGVRMALAHPPDLVLVDLNLPGLDGFEVTLRLRGEGALGKTPIVAITAEGDRETCFAVGCDGFIQKPIDARRFAAQVQEFMGGYREAADSPAATGEKLRQQGGRIVARLEEKVAELSRANARLRDAERLRTEFYRNISHELATPLTPVVGYLRMLLDEDLGPLEPAQAKALRSMDDCVRRLRTTLDNLVDVTGLETGQMRFFHKDFDIRETIDRALAQSASSFSQRGLRPVLELAPGPLPAYGDEARLGRAILQLLDNAAKFGERGAIGVRLTARPDGYEIAVADGGPGFPEEGRDRVFEAFFQVDGSPTRAHGGVGVGLAIARKVARGLGGDVHIAGPAVIGGERFGGAVLVLTVAKRAPMVVLEGRA